MDDNKDGSNYLLPPKTSNKKTLVLDLDETLVHSQFYEFSTPSDIIIKIQIEKEIYDIHVLVRPGVKEFLEEMKDYYEIVIFTASVSKYADILMNIIDQKGCCPYRLFREHCTFVNNIFVKDLKRLGRDLKDIIIVDNSPLSYSFHPNNGLPILSWFEDKDDVQLYNITPILIFLSNVNDVREYIPKIVINNFISFTEVEKLFKIKGFKYGEKNRILNNMKLNNLEQDLNKVTKKLNNNNSNEYNNKKNSKKYNINIQIVQNNINNINNINNNIIDEKNTTDIKNKLITYLNLENKEYKNSTKQKKKEKKYIKINPQNIITNIDNPNIDKNKMKSKEKFKNHKRQNTFSINIKHTKLLNKNKDNNSKKNNEKIKKQNVVNKNKDIIKKIDKSVQYTQIKNIINKKRKRLQTPMNINSIIFTQKNSKITKLSLSKNTLSNNPRAKKRNKSNNERCKLLMPIESSEINLIKKLCTLSNKVRVKKNKPKRNINYFYILQNKTKSKSSGKSCVFPDKNETINNSINANKYNNANNNLYKKFKIEENFFTSSHRKQNSYNENNFYLKIKKNLIKQQDSRTKSTINNKNEFLKNEIQKVANSNKGNSNINDYKNKLIKRAYANFKKINLKNIDFITKRDKKKFQIDLKNKNIDKNLNINFNKLNIKGNIFNLYKTINIIEKKDESNIFNNTTDKFIKEKMNCRKIIHQKAISYNFNSTRTFNNIIKSKEKFQNKFKKIYHSKIKSIANNLKKHSKKELKSNENDISKSKKDDCFGYIKNMFKHKFFDYSYTMKNNINVNNINMTKSKKEFKECK